MMAIFFLHIAGVFRNIGLYIAEANGNTGGSIPHSKHVNTR